AHHVAAGLNPGRGVHIALTASDERDQHPVDFIDAGADVEHRLAVVWIGRFEAGGVRLRLDTVEVFHVDTVAGAACPVQGARGRRSIGSMSRPWDQTEPNPICDGTLTTR